MTATSVKGNVATSTVEAARRKHRPDVASAPGAAASGGRGAMTRAPATAPLATGLALLFGLAAAGCASVPENAVAERLDERTGTTVTAMQRPVELVATEPRGANSDPFAYLAPFETNRMGARQLYLWVAVPDERGGAAVPVVLVGDQTLSLRPLGADPRSAGLASFPYPTPAPWSALQAYQVDEATLRKLGDAATLDLTVRYADGRVVRFSGAPRPPGILGEFLRSLGL